MKQKFVSSCSGVVCLGRKRDWMIYGEMTKTLLLTWCWEEVLSVLPQFCQKTINPTGPTLCLNYKQVIKNAFGPSPIFTPHQLFSHPLPPLLHPPPPSPCTDFVSQLWNETVTFSLTAHRQKMKASFFFLTIWVQISLPVCLGNIHLLFWIILNNCDLTVCI